MSLCKNFDGIFSRFYTIPDRDGQTYGHLATTYNALRIASPR